MYFMIMMIWLIKIVCHTLAVSCDIQDVTNIQEEHLL
jgi:hypothetical protein